MDILNDLTKYYEGPNGELPSFYSVSFSIGATITTYLSGYYG